MTDDPTTPETYGGPSQEKSTCAFDIDQLTSEDLPVVFGRYEILGLLGQGGMARVFHAELHGPAGFRKPVALKVIKCSPGTKAHPHRVLDLVREACMAGRLKHPNLVDVYELGQVDDQPFISMELVEGCTLAQLIRSRGSIPSAVLMEIAVSMTAGLTKAHDQASERQPTGLVHCDLKPSNILISRDGAVKIADFGIAIFGMSPDSSSHPAKPERLRGTPPYMSPEQLKGEPLDGRSDLFSLALVIAVMVLGRNPLKEVGMREVLLSGCPLPDPLIGPKVVASLDQAVPGLGAILLRCLAPDRRNRYPDSNQLLEDLQILQDAVGHHPRLRTWLQTSTWTQRSTAHSPTQMGDQGGHLAEAETLIRRARPKRTNLASPLDTFVGREADLKKVEHLFKRGARFVTVKGTGGAGKTRVAQHYARNALAALPGGAWFADLTEARSLLGILHAVANALDLKLNAAEDPAQLSQHLGQAIASRGAMLLVLDNFEQVLEYASDTLGRWRALAPDAQFLVTSRESLRLAGEVIFPLGPLPPQDGAALFESRARTAGAQWGGDTENQAIIGKLVAQLDGLPLAIELAAARTRMMSPEQILKRLSQRFDLLGGARRGDSARQATLRGLIDWSWDLLEPWEKAALAQLSVFRDGFFMEAAEAVMDLSAWPEAPWSLDVVGSLLDKSLLHSRKVLGQPRFEMYVSIQEYAEEKLVGGRNARQPEARQEAQRRHAAWFGSMGPQGNTRLLDVETGSRSWAELHCELENLLAGTRHGTPEAAAWCSIAAIRVLMLTGPVSLGADLAARMLQLPAMPRHLQMQLEIGHSRCLRLSGRIKEATEAIRGSAPRSAVSGICPLPIEGGQSSRHLDSTGEESSETERLAQEGASVQGEDEVLAILEADGLVELGNLEFERSEYAAAGSHYHSALDIFRQHQHRKGEGNVLGQIGNVYLYQGKLDEAIGQYQAALVVHRERGDKRLEGTILANTGNVYLSLGKVQEATEHYQRAYTISQEVGNKHSEGTILGSLGNVHHMQGRLDEAREHYERALEISREVGDKRFEAVFLTELGGVLFELTRTDEAEAALREAIPLADKTMPLVAGVAQGTLALLLTGQGQIEEAQHLLETGEPKVAPQLEEYAKFLCKKGKIQLMLHKASLARASLGRAQSLAEELGVGAHSEIAVAVDELRGLLDAEGCHPDPMALIEAERLAELGHLASGQGQFTEAAGYYRDALDVFRRQGDRGGEARVLGSLGNVHLAQDRFDHASECIIEAVDIAREIGDEVVLGRYAGNLGNIYKAKGDYDRAAELYRQACDIAREIGDMSNLGSYLGNLGDTLFELKRLDEAEIAFQQAIANCDDTFPAAAGAFRGSLALLMAQDGQLDEALVLLEKGEAQIVVFPEEHAKFLCKKGQAQLLAGQLPAARASLTQARTLTSGLHLGESREISSAIAQLESLLGGSSIEDPVSAHPSTEEGMLEILEGDRLVELGRIQYEESKFEEATGNFQAALDIYRAHQTRRGEGEALMELGKVCRQEGNPRKATYYFECALQIYRHIGDRQLEGVVLGDLGNVYQQQDQLDDAIEHYTLALEIHREMGARRFEGRVLGNLGSAYLAQGRFDEVIEHYQLALEINREFGNKRFEAAILGNLGSVYRVQGKLGEAITQYKLALPIYREIGDRRFEGVFLGNLGSAYRLQGELEEAVKHYTLALEIHREFGDERFEGAFLGNLGEALVELGRIDEARQAFEASISACDATGYLVGAGSFRGHLALLLARQGQSAKAWDLLDTGESYLVTHPHDHGRLLCTKGQVQLMDEQRDAARVSLASAQAIASQIGVGEHSELVMEIAKLEMLLDGDATEELATDPAY